MNPQLLQMLLPYLLQLFGQGQNGQSSLSALFGQNGQNELAQPTMGVVGGQNLLQPATPAGASAPSAPLGGSAQAPTGVVGGMTPMTGGTSAPASSPQSAISPTGAPQSLSGIWSSLLSGLQNNSLTGQSSAGGNFFGLGG